MSIETFQHSTDLVTQLSPTVNTENETITMEAITSISLSSLQQEQLPLWVTIFNFTQLGFTVVGFAANLLTLFTLTLNQTGFNRLVLILLRHQSFVDSMVCLLASIVVVQPFMWTTGVTWLDRFICHAWHGQAFYWGAVTLSTYNLVCLAVERYVAVTKPLKYPSIINMGRKSIAGIFLMLYFGTLAITHGTYLQTRLQEGECLNKYFMDGKAVETYFFWFVIFTYVTTYCIPAVVMAVLYGIVACKLHRRKKDTSLGYSMIIEKASWQLTKTAVIVTVIFIVTIGYDLHYYLFGYTGIITYDLNTPIQKFGVFLSNLNSCVNPFVYAMLMPQYRQNLWNSCRCIRVRPKLQGSGLTSIQSAVSRNVSVVSTVVDMSPSKEDNCSKVMYTVQT